eukprot:TRINITY_DN184_c0_g1_i1.p1 TRINITY_DN184_c0_g1~~TRINITY_DN184_c0_g1_i1.p1  ORF type:complete len:440 (+),score=114.31 TRINITY_DN184_c0_g1_i1:312-1631(+)
MERLATIQSHIKEAGIIMSCAADGEEAKAVQMMKDLAAKHGLDVRGAKVRRTSSRFCLGVEHGDYNGTELFGVGTDRFIWLAYKKRSDNKVRIASVNFPNDGLTTWTLGSAPAPGTHPDSWARFPYGADYVLTSAGYPLTTGFDAVVYGNIPGGGMSRSASLSINLVLTMMEVNNLTPKKIPLGPDGKSYEIVDLAQQIETKYIGSPSGYLDQIMIYYAKAGLGTHFLPKTNEVRHIPLGCDANTFSIGALDTGTDRPGLEKSTYAIRSAECKKAAKMLSEKYPGQVSLIADLNDAQYAEVMAEWGAAHPNLCERIRYIHEAKGRFSVMLDAWKSGDIKTVGQVFRTDGFGLRDIYRISGPELEVMCDIVRTVPGCLGERMLGGGDKGASGCIVEAGAEQQVLAAVQTAYPRSHPELTDKYAVHFVKVCDGVVSREGLF